MTDHQIAYNRLLEERRANLAKEIEAHRSNVANEGLKGQEIAERERAAKAGEFENMRHNEVAEGETNRHNLATEAAQVYGIDVNQALGSGNIGLGYANLRETNRANTRNESLKEWATSADNAYKTAMAASKVKETEIKQLEADIKANEFNLDYDIRNAQKELAERKQSYDELTTGVHTLGDIVKFVPTLMNTFDLIENSIYGF